MLLLASRLQIEVDFIQKNVFIPVMYRNAFSELPDDILIRIVRNIPQDDRFACLGLNRRVREVLRSCAELWAEIRTTYRPEKVKTMLKWSKAAPLHFHVTGTYEDVLQFQLSAKSHIYNKNSRARVTFDRSAYANTSTPGCVLSNFAHFRCVTALELPSFSEDADEDRDLDEGFDEELALSRHFVHTLEDFNSVTELTLREDIPPVSTLFPSLKHLRILLDRPSLFRQEELSKFLSGRALLRDLAIEVDASEHMDYVDFKWTEPTTCIHLPGLQHLDVSLRMESKGDEEEDDDDEQRSFTESFYNLIHSIEAPNVEQIRLNWTQDDDFYLEAEIAPLPCPKRLFRYERMTRVKEFVLSLAPFSNEQWSKVKDFLTCLESGMPSVQRVICQMPPHFFEANTLFDLRTHPASFASLEFDTDFHVFAKRVDHIHSNHGKMENGEVTEWEAIRNSLSHAKLTLCST